LPADPDTAYSGAVASNDRAFLYGDGVFETLLSFDGQPLWIDLHLDRLSEGARRLSITLDREAVLTALLDAAAQEQPQVIRITVSRGAGPRGYCPSPEAAAVITTSATALNRNPFTPLSAARLQTSSIVMAEQPLLAGIKHCNRLEQVLAAAEAGQLGVDDVLLKRQSGSFQCSSNANLFVLVGNTLMTPDCDRCGVAGTRRRLLIEQLCPALDIPVAEGPVGDAEIRSARGLCLSNSVMGLRIVSAMDTREFSPEPELLALQNAYYEAARACCAH
jgi:aminodeoxychorismate lyase